MYATRLFVCVAALTVLAWGSIISGPGHLALVLDGTTSVAIPSDASSLAGKSFSFEAWIVVPNVGTQMPIASRINSSSSAPTNEQNDFSLQINAQGNVILFFGGSSDNMGFLINSATTIQSNTWYHIAFTIEYLNTDNDTPYRATLYVDSYPSGKLVRDMQIAYWYGPGHSRISLTNEVITVGKYINNINPAGIFFSGSIDEIRVWQGVRAGSDMKSYSMISIENQADSLWALTPTQGGTSSQLLVCSYNMNQGASRNRATSSLPDQSKNHFTATITGNAGFGSNPNQFIQYVRVSGEVPAVVPLYGIDSTTSSSAGVQFVVYWIDSELQGELFAFSSLNTGRPNKTHPYNPPERKEVVGLGSMVVNNSNVDVTERTAIVYVSLPNFTGTNARLRYYAVLGGVQSPVTEVRLIVGCAGNQSLIDKCGVCLGDNSTCRYCAHIDRCGVCNGTNACVGCDNVTNSGMVIDQCGVCGGLNLCFGCDHMGGGVKDACGVCNGDNSTCGLPVMDDCGVLGGDNSNCTCQRYHGYHVQELDYLLLKWGIQTSLSNIDRILAQLDESLTLLQNYDGDVDLASMVAFLNGVTSSNVVPYDAQISYFVNELNKALGE